MSLEPNIREELFDDETLADLLNMSEGDPKFLDKVLSIFGEHLNGHLRHLTVQQNSTELTLTAHALKSSTLQVGAKKLSALCQKLEDFNKFNLSKSEVENLISDIRDCANDTEALLRDIVLAWQRERIA